MRSIADIKREIANDVSQRNSRDNPDAKDYLLRSRLLDFDKSQSEAAQVYEVTLQEILITCYPELFIRLDEQFQINPELDNVKRNEILSAFGLTIPKPGQEVGPFKISYDQFDFKQFELLFAADKNPLWLVLEQNIALDTKSKSVPLGQSSSSFLSDQRIPFSATDKVKNYLELARAFKAGRTVQVVQTLRRVSTSVFSSVQNALKSSGVEIASQSSNSALAKIQTPGPDKAMQEVLKMANRAIDLAIEYPECRALIESELRPLKNWTVAETIQDSVLPRAFVSGIQAAVTPDTLQEEGAERADNLGDWILKNAPICCPPGDEIKDAFYAKLAQLPAMENQQQQEAEATSLNVSKFDGLYAKERTGLQTIVERYKTASSESSEGQRYEVAQAAINYLEGTEPSWFSICELKVLNPDWSSPESFSGLFTKSPLSQCIANIEGQEEGAKLAAKFYKKLPLLEACLSKAEVNNLKEQMRMKSKPSVIKLTALQASLSKQSKPELSNLVQEISLFLTRSFESNKASRQEQIKAMSGKLGKK